MAQANANDACKRAHRPELSSGATLALGLARTDCDPGSVIDLIVEAYRINRDRRGRARGQVLLTKRQAIALLRKKPIPTMRQVIDVIFMEPKR